MQATLKAEACESKVPGKVKQNQFSLRNPPSKIEIVFSYLKPEFVFIDLTLKPMEMMKWA